MKVIKQIRHLIFDEHLKNVDTSDYHQVIVNGCRAMQDYAERYHEHQVNNGVLDDVIFCNRSENFDKYLIDVGIRAFEYESEIDNERRELIKDNVHYFKKCYKTGLSAYKALLFFPDYLNGDYEI